MNVLRLMRFGIVGIMASITYASTVAILIGAAEFQSGFASIIGYLLGIPVSFLGHKYFTFETKSRSLKELLRFVFVQAINIAASYFLMVLVAEWLGFSYWLGIAVVVFGSALMTYGLLKIFVFIDAT